MPMENHEVCYGVEEGRSGDITMCPSCASTYTYVCDECDERISRNHIGLRDSIRVICDQCSDNYYYCVDCGVIVDGDRAEWIGDNPYCRDCAENHLSVIRDYHFKPCPVFLGNTPTDEYMGVELEIDRGSHREECAQDILHEGEGFVYIKEDGSLENEGMEIVTHPATLDYHMRHMPWEAMTDIARHYDYRSHNTSTCGLHVHVSRTFFGFDCDRQDLTIAKIMLIFDKFWNTHIVKFSRRDYSALERWADKPDANICKTDTDIDAIGKAYDVGRKGRYQAINLRNENTIEFRIFRGTLRRDTIIATLEWIHVLIEYCKKTSLSDLWSVTWENLFRNTGYTELNDYLNRRGL